MNAALVTAFRRYCWSHSRAVLHQDGRLGALRRILADLPTFYT